MAEPPKWRQLNDLRRRGRRLRKSDPEASAVIEKLSIPEAWAIRKLLPLPRGPRLGRRQQTKRLLDELRARLANSDEPPTTAAKAVLREHGVGEAQLKDRADYLVKMLNVSGNK